MHTIIRRFWGGSPLALSFALVLSSAAAAQSAKPGPLPTSGDAEMARIFAADQTARQGPNIDWSKVGPADAERRAATRRLLDQGRLKTAADFSRAAFVFQHGGESGDYLLAHTLALVAVSKGEHGALWIASASLDRYLVQIGQKQIYGTQFQRAGAQPWTQEPYDRTLVSDTLRSQLGVPVFADQQARIAKMNAELKQHDPLPPPAVPATKP